MQLIFFICVLLIVYTYAGYWLFIFSISRLRKWFGRRNRFINTSDIPSITVIVAAYNEAYCINEKIQNTLSLNYPNEKVKYIFITDGSTDGTPDIVRNYELIRLLHLPARQGKVAALNRAMLHVDTDLVVFSDANTLINVNALVEMAHHYNNEKVGVVAGEKKILNKANDAIAGEGIYWKYESLLRKWDAAVYSSVGAAGELYSIRTALYEPLLTDTLCDDFMISMQIAARGYRIAYEPKAVATEKASADVWEELKRKTRIAAGCIQALARLRKLFLQFRQPILVFQYISHKVLRWVAVPYAMIIALFINIALVARGTGKLLNVFLIIQLLFYGIALVGISLEKRKIKAGPFFVPFYFCLMNYAAIVGMYRYLFNKQTVLWEKIKRKE